MFFRDACPSILRLVYTFFITLDSFSITQFRYHNYCLTDESRRVAINNILAIELRVANPLLLLSCTLFGNCWKTWESVNQTSMYVLRLKMNNCIILYLCIILKELGGREIVYRCPNTMDHSIKFHCLLRLMTRQHYVVVVAAVI